MSDQSLPITPATDPINPPNSILILVEGAPTDEVLLSILSLIVYLSYPALDPEQPSLFDLLDFLDYPIKGA